MPWPNISTSFPMVYLKMEDHEPSPTARPKLACDQCNRSFTRPSHLNRHRLTHVPHSQRRTIQCSYCERSFSRQDVLLRHLRASHDMAVGNGGSSQKSCNRCVRHKLKCDRVMPCGSCYSAKTPDTCSYPYAKSLHEMDCTASRDMDQTDGAQAIVQEAGFSNGVDFQQYDDQSASKDYRNYTIQASPGAGFAGFDQAFGPMVLEDGCSPAFDNGNTPSDGNATVYSQSLDATLPFDFRGSGFDWLDFDISNIQLPLDNQPALQDNLPPATTAYSTAPPNTMMPHLPAIPPRPHALPWPFEQGKDSRPSRFPLPRLHDVLQQSSQGSPGDPQAPLDCLFQLLSQQQLPSPKQVTSRNLTSGVELMNHLIDSYFTGFQIIQPIVHAPTWTVNDCPTMLLAAMVCVGSVLSTNPGPDEVSEAIGEFCASMITWLVSTTLRLLTNRPAPKRRKQQPTNLAQGISDSANYSNISYLAALCLHQIYSLGSGNRQLYQNADRTRGVLVGSLRGLGLLNARLNIQEETADSNGATLDQTNTYAEWISWAARERDNRIAWASFEYDCSLCTLTNRRGAVDLGELPSRLPCTESLWEAPSAHAWAALRFRSPSKAQGAKLSSVLKAAMTGQPLGDHVSMWGRRLCGQVIGRLLWDLKQLEALSTTDYFDLPSLFKAHQHSKTSLLRGLDSLLESMEQPCSTSDLVSYKYDDPSSPCRDTSHTLVIMSNVQTFAANSDTPASRPFYATTPTCMPPTTSWT